MMMLKSQKQQNEVSKNNKEKDNEDLNQREEDSMLAEMM